MSILYAEENKDQSYMQDIAKRIEIGEIVVMMLFIIY
jgi:hypothetical protein